MILHWDHWTYHSDLLSRWGNLWTFGAAYFGQMFSHLLPGHQVPAGTGACAASASQLMLRLGVSCRLHQLLGTSMGIHLWLVLLCYSTCKLIWAIAYTWMVLLETAMLGLHITLQTSRSDVRNFETERTHTHTQQFVTHDPKFFQKKGSVFVGGIRIYPLWTYWSPDVGLQGLPWRAKWESHRVATGRDLAHGGKASGVNGQLKSEV